MPKLKITKGEDFYERTFEGYIIFDWHTGKSRIVSSESIVKREQKDGTVFPIKFKIKIKKPIIPMETIEREVLLTDAQMSDIFVKSL